MFTVLKNYTKLQLSEQFFFVEFKRFVSYKHMGCSLPLLYKTIGKVLDEAAEKFGDKTALVSMHQNQRLSFNEVKEKVSFEFFSYLL